MQILGVCKHALVVHPSKIAECAHARRWITPSEVVHQIWSVELLDAMIGLSRANKQAHRCLHVSFIRLEDHILGRFDGLRF
jgi:hypothetical protein